jgi:hypothetical protein
MMEIRAMLANSPKNPIIVGRVGLRAATGANGKTAMP